MSFSTQTQKTTTYTITSESAARRVIGRGGSNIKKMRDALGNGLYVRVEATKTRRCSSSKLTSDGYVPMTCVNSSGDNRTVNIFVGASPPRDSDGNILVMVKPVIVSAWGKTTVDSALKQIDAITNRPESDLTATVANCAENLIKHVIGARGSGLRRLERFVGDGCYISCSDGVFVVKANTKSATLRGKIVVEKKIHELSERFRLQKKKPLEAIETGVLGSNAFDIFADDSDESDDEAGDEVVESETHATKELSKSVKRRLRRKEAKKAAKEAEAEVAILADPSVVSIISNTSDSSSVEDTVEMTSDSSPESPPLSGVWGDQDVTISESLEDAVTRGDTFETFFERVPLKKSSRGPSLSVPKELSFEIMDDVATKSSEKLVLERSLKGVEPVAGLTKKFSDMTKEFAVGTWASDSDDE